MSKADLHYRKYPHARTATIMQLQKQDRMTARLRAETAQGDVNRFRDSIGWQRPGIIDRMLEALGIRRGA